LLSKKPKKVAIYYKPHKEYPGTYTNESKGIRYRFWLVKPFVFLRKQYKGKIVVLIDSKAISQSETVCMMFKAYSNNVTFIGTPTTGANGNVSTIHMPGGISFRFTSLDWHFPNGDQLQRIGIVPDIYVKENIEGIKLGKDQILERAIKYTEN
jgi:C-terminal processing protease CtpA/Prc